MCDSIGPPDLATAHKFLGVEVLHRRANLHLETGFLKLGDTLRARDAIGGILPGFIQAVPNRADNPHTRDHYTFQFHGLNPPLREHVPNGSGTRPATRRAEDPGGHGYYTTPS